MDVLNQFILRLSFGLALAMSATSPRLVTSGYFRNHAYVLLGLNVLASMVAVTRPEEFFVWPPILASLLSYAAAVSWLYEKLVAGRLLLLGIAIVTLAGAVFALLSQAHESSAASGGQLLLWSSDVLTGGLLLGSTIAAMFLGHWYLNSPTMQLAPLERLVRWMAAATLVRAACAATGLGLTIAETGWPSGSQLSFLGLRWISGLLGVLGLIWMTRQTLRIPNTQAATGILYVAVIAVFLGELTAQLLSRTSTYPL